MAYKLTVDLEKCQGYANCLIEGPALFDIDDDTDKAVVLNEFPPEELQGQAKAAVRGCPAQAIFFEEES